MEHIYVLDEEQSSEVNIGICSMRLGHDKDSISSLVSAADQLGTSLASGIIISISEDKY